MRTTAAVRAPNRARYSGMLRRSAFVCMSRWFSMRVTWLGVCRRMPCSATSKQFGQTSFRRSTFRGLKSALRSGRGAGFNPQERTYPRHATAHSQPSLVDPHSCGLKSALRSDQRQLSLWCRFNHRAERLAGDCSPPDTGGALFAERCDANMAMSINPTPTQIAESATLKAGNPISAPLRR